MDKQSYGNCEVCIYFIYTFHKCENKINDWPENMISLDNRDNTKEQT